MTPKEKELVEKLKTILNYMHQVNTTEGSLSSLDDDLPDAAANISSALPLIARLDDDEYKEKFERVDFEHLAKRKAHAIEACYKEYEKQVKAPHAQDNSSIPSEPEGTGVTTAEHQVDKDTDEELVHFSQKSQDLPEKTVDERLRTFLKQLQEFQEVVSLPDVYKRSLDSIISPIKDNYPEYYALIDKPGASVESAELTRHDKNALLQAQDMFQQEVQLTLYGLATHIDYRAATNNGTLEQQDQLLIAELIACGLEPNFVKGMIPQCPDWLLEEGILNTPEPSEPSPKAPRQKEKARVELPSIQRHASNKKAKAPSPDTVTTSHSPTTLPPIDKKGSSLDTSAATKLFKEKHQQNKPKAKSEEKLKSSSDPGPINRGKSFK